MGGPCDFCSYAKKRTMLTIEALQAKNKSQKSLKPKKIAVKAKGAKK
jgi:hypothetical protein